MPTNYSEKLLLVALRNNDEKALEYLFHEHYNRLFRIAMKVEPDIELAKECIQQVFNELWMYRQTVSDIESFEGYLKSAVKRRVLRLCTQQKKNKMKELTAASNIPMEVSSWEEVFIEQQSRMTDRKKVTAMLEQLSPRQKEIIELKYFEELTYQEICAHTGLQIDTIYKTLHGAIKKLRLLTTP